jgi:hypothetical protein
LAFSLNYAFVVIVAIVGIFAVLYAAMPLELFLHQADYIPNLVNQEVKANFEATDLTVYSSFAQDTMIYDYSSIGDAPDPPQWETTLTNRYIEVWWGDEYIPDVGSIGKTFEVRDTEKRNFIIDYFVRLEWLDLTIDDSAGIDHVGVFLNRASIEPYGSQNNLTLSATGEYLSASLILRANNTDTLLEGWDDGTLGYDLTYELDFEAMKPSAFLLLAQLITFQSPEFGIPGLFGEIISYVFGIAFWAAVALIAYTVVTKLIPTIQGGLEN